MFIEVDSIQIKKPGGNYISLGDYNNQTPRRCLILEAKYQYNKLWSADSGRNLAGKQSGTLTGIYPKIIVQFDGLTKDELEAIAPILDAPRQIVRYYDPRKKAYRTMETYTGDYEITNKGMVGTFTKNGITNIKKNEGFSISFIATERRK